MTLIARERMIHGADGIERLLVVACPQRIDPVPIRECATCELCEGLDLDGSVAVRCAVAPPELVDGSPAASAAETAIMTSPVEWVAKDAAIENVQWLMIERGISAVPVLDEAGAMVGIVSSLDIVRWVAARERFAPRGA